MVNVTALEGSVVGDAVLAQLKTLAQGIVYDPTIQQTLYNFGADAVTLAVKLGTQTATDTGSTFGPGTFLGDVVKPMIDPVVAGAADRAKTYLTVGVGIGVGVFAISCIASYLIGKKVGSKGSRS